MNFKVTYLPFLCVCSKGEKTSIAQIVNKCYDDLDFEIESLHVVDFPLVA